MSYRANAKCIKCGKWVKKTHVEASEWPDEELEIVCEDCEEAESRQMLDSMDEPAF